MQEHRSGATIGEFKFYHLDQHVCSYPRGWCYAWARRWAGQSVSDATIEARLFLPPGLSPVTPRCHASRRGNEHVTHCRVYCTLYTVHCDSLRSVLYTIHSTLWLTIMCTIHYTLYTVAHYSVYYSLYPLHFTLWRTTLLCYPKHFMGHLFHGIKGNLSGKEK